MPFTRWMNAFRSRSCGGCMSAIGKNSGRVPLATAHAPKSDSPRAAYSTGSFRETRQSARKCVRSRAKSTPKSRNQPDERSRFHGPRVRPIAPTIPCTFAGRKSTRIDSVSDVRSCMVMPSQPGTLTRSLGRIPGPSRNVPRRGHPGPQTPTQT